MISDNNNSKWSSSPKASQDDSDGGDWKEGAENYDAGGQIRMIEASEAFVLFYSKMWRQMLRQKHIKKKEFWQTRRNNRWLKSFAFKPFFSKTVIPAPQTRPHSLSMSSRTHINIHKKEKAGNTHGCLSFSLNSLHNNLHQPKRGLHGNAHWGALGNTI